MCDNCVNVKNPGQRDTDGDGYGSLCDADLNNDGKINTLDLGLFKKAMQLPKYDPAYKNADFNGDGNINTLDLGIFKLLFANKIPGPSGLKK